MNATVPFARLELTAGGATGGPSASFLGSLVPTFAYRWEDLIRIEPVGWPFAPFIADGVRFLTFDGGFIFWCGSAWRRRRILDFCETAAPRLVSRTRQPAPVFGLR